MLSRVSRLARHLDRERRAAFEDTGLEVWEFDVLAALRRADTPLTPGQLLTQTLVSSGTMTHRLGRLSDKGLVERLPDPSDGRSVRVRLTEAGVGAADRAVGALLGRERALLERLSDEDRATLADLLRTLLMPFDGTDRR